MDKKTKERAVELLVSKKGNPEITYAEIEQATGYSRRQLMRMSKRIDEEGAQAVLEHGNAGRKPACAATEEEVAYIRRLKEPYRSITIAQLRDIYIEDVIENPDKAGDVERYGLAPRSKSWFRDLFAREGWVSPASRPCRADGGRQTHPLREPAPRRGMLVQVDGTPFDWFGDGDARVLHIAVDDATTEVLAGCFMPTECIRGYARMTERMVLAHGAPEALYSDKHSVFVSTKGRAKGPTQYAMMLSDLGIRQILAGSPQAKGRVERYNYTEQLRLVNDIIRFGVRDYDHLDSWFNEFYAAYLNAKFSFPPAEASSAFRPLPEGFEPASVFRVRHERIARNGMISYEMGLYLMVDGDGVVYDPGEGVRVNLYIDVWTEEMYVERYGKRYACVLASVRRHEKTELVGNQKELQELLDKMGRRS